MKEIQLTQGQVVLCDDGDYEMLMQYKWCASYCHKGKRYYATSKINGKNVNMIHILFEKIPGTMIDHVDRNSLNYCRHNLRRCTNSQNQANQKLRTDNTSGFKGVQLNKEHNIWEAFIKIHGRRTYLGGFRDKGFAALAYDTAALHYFGEFALTNKMMGLL